MKDKKLPNWIKSGALQKLLRSKTGIVLSYWAFQGMLYADYREVLFKLLLDAVSTVLLSIVFGAPFYLSLLASHTMNMLFNGHVIAMRRHMGLGINDPARFINYVERLGKRAGNKSFIRAAAAYGSLTRNSYRLGSDLDVRIVPREGGISFLRACLFATAERTRAFLAAFPLDLYVFELENLKKKMNPNESPIIFHDPERVLEKSYSKVVHLKQHLAAFRASHV